MRFFYVRHKGEMMKDEAYLKMLGTAVWESPVPIYIIHVEVDEAGKSVVGLQYMCYTLKT